MKKVFLVTIIFLNFCSYAQEVQVNTNLNPDATNTVLSAYVKPVTKTFSEEKIKGNKYYESEFQIAEVYVGEKILRKYATRYNAYSDEIEVESNDKKFVLSKSEDIRVITKDYTYQFSNHKINKGYFIIFNKEKKTSLVLKAKKKIKEAVEPKSGFGSYVPPSFVKDYNYYIRNFAGHLIPIKLKKKDVLKVLKDKEKEIEKFASSNKLSFKKERDLVKIVSHYNTL